MDRALLHLYTGIQNQAGVAATVENIIHEVFSEQSNGKDSFIGKELLSIDVVNSCIVRLSSSISLALGAKAKAGLKIQFDGSFEAGIVYENDITDQLNPQLVFDLYQSIRGLNRKKFTEKVLSILAK